MAISEPLETIKCAWCGEDNLVACLTTNTVDCVHCGRGLEIHRSGGLKWPLKWYSVRITQNTRTLINDQSP